MSKNFKLYLLLKYQAIPALYFNRAFKAYELCENALYWLGYEPLREGFHPSHENKKNFVVEFKKFNQDYPSCLSGVYDTLMVELNDA